jgi:hypothetical protein
MFSLVVWGVTQAITQMLRAIHCRLTSSKQAEQHNSTVSNCPGPLCHVTGILGRRTVLPFKPKAYTALHAIEHRYSPPWKMDWNMIDDSTSLHTCSSCNRPFPGPGPLNYHRRSCQSTKRRLQGALAKAKELWEARKKLRRHPLEEQPNDGGSTADVAMCIEASTPSAVDLPLAFGNSITPYSLAETDCLPLPAASTHAHLPSIDSADAVRGDLQAIVTDF